MLKLHSLLKRTKETVARDTAFYIAAAISVILTVIYFSYLGLLDQLNLTMYGIFMSSQLDFSIRFLLLFYLFHVLKVGGKSPMKVVSSDLKHLLTKPETWLGVLFFIVISSIVFSAYTNTKTTIGVTYPFIYDRSFYDLDKLIHGGISPWKITHNIFSGPTVTFIINLLYNIWFFLVFLTYLLVYFRNDHFRKQFLVTYIVTWMFTGGLLAVIFSSAGPCFVANELGVDWYGSLFHKLGEHQNWLLENYGIDLWALTTQQNLWNSHVAEASTLGAGVSAMPSMHVATTTVMALGARAHSRALGYIGYTYLAAIQIGSVHLGWHYAVDGYASILITLLLWKLVGKLLTSNNEQKSKTLQAESV
ncbi:phosphatase PAP2 family protein [Vibrio sp. qd031]|uniref:phosphatase PAP2 family protein n=1 Tax=Vibrio sp. qd031 TaxID=1603038 RepID=UPI000A0F5758|nr:phosphatase PAP2 family protein [Vibrio sp. qd031]